MKFDHEKLREAVREKMRDEGLTFKGAELACGMSSSSLHKFLGGQRVTTDNAAKLLAWVAGEPERFVEGARPRVEPVTTLDKIEAALFNDPQLSLADALRLSALLGDAYKNLTA